MATPLIETTMERRLRNALERVGVTTVEDLANMTALQLLACPRVGVSSATRIRSTLLVRGLDLRPHSPHVYPYDASGKPFDPVDRLPTWMDNAKAEETLGMRRYAVITSAWKPHGTVHVYWCKWAEARSMSWFSRADQLPERAKDCKECEGSGVRP
jgi:hypothetical protein